MRVCLLLYAYGVGVLSSRKSARACARHRAFRALVGTERPDLRTLSAVRPPPLEACQDVLVPVVRLAREAGVVQRGNVSTEGTQIQGHASRHQAMRDGARQQAVERRREEIAALVPAAYRQDAAEEAAWGRRRGEARPAEVARREERVARSEAARHRVEAQAQAAAAAARQEVVKLSV
jgi:hypothetical protein